MMFATLFLLPKKKASKLAGRKAYKKAYKKADGKAYKKAYRKADGKAYRKANLKAKRKNESNLLETVIHEA
jgi:hypothetical protein